MVKIFINGESGKMGSSIIKLINDHDFIKVEKIKLADVVIDFSHPNSTLKILQDCIKYKKPFVIGTTGLSKIHFKEIEEASKVIPIFHSANMSKGISNLKESLSNYISKSSEPMSCIIEEIHHTEKIDTPSGTALELRDHIIKIDNKNIESIDIKSKRIENVFGIHKVSFVKKDGVTEFKHEALSRDIFARGALDEARYINENELLPGIYKNY